MSHLKTRVGSWKLDWKSVPRGREGVAEVGVQTGQTVEVRWRRDSDGIWLQLPHGVFGFDFQGERDEDGQIVYHIAQRGGHQEWSGASSSLGETPIQNLGANTQNKPTRIRAQMPGKIIRIQVKVGDLVQKDQPLAVMEAMKMENEIRSPQAGKIHQVNVVEGQTVETGADLVILHK